MTSLWIRTSFGLQNLSLFNCGNRPKAELLESTTRGAFGPLCNLSDVSVGPLALKWTKSFDNVPRSRLLLYYGTTTWMKAAMESICGMPTHNTTTILLRTPTSPRVTKRGSGALRTMWGIRLLLQRHLARLRLALPWHVGVMKSLVKGRRMKAELRYVVHDSTVHELLVLV